MAKTIKNGELTWQTINEGINQSFQNTQEEREESLEDRRFSVMPSAQWEGTIGDQFANRTQMVVDMVHRAISDIESDYRQNEIDAVFTSKDGTDKSKLVDMVASLHRADMKRNNAEEIFANAFHDAITGGLGAWRYRVVKDDEFDPENEKNKIAVEWIPDADQCVFFDPNAVEQDKSDAEWVAYAKALGVEAYKRLFGKERSSFPVPESQNTGFDWFRDESKQVIIVEYYRIEIVEEKKRRFVALNDEEVFYDDDDFEENQELLQELLDTGYKEGEPKVFKERKIRKVIADGSEIIKDYGYIGGKFLPIVPNYGEYAVIEGCERFQGLTRRAKDAQRCKNMAVSGLVDQMATGGNSKPIFAPEQMAGVGHLWQEDSVQNYPYLLAKPIYGADGQILVSGPTGLKEAPRVPEALTTTLGLIDNDLRAMTGNRDGADKIVANISGDAVEMILARIREISYIYINNHAKARRHGARVWLSMARDTYVENNRRMKTVDSNNQVSSVLMNSGSIIDDEGALIRENDLSEADFDVEMAIGPSATSRRQATMKALTTLNVADQEIQSLTGWINLKLLEGEGMGDINKYARKRLVRMGVEEPTEEERQQMLEEAQNTQPTAQDKYLQAEAANAESKALLNKTSAAKNVAEAKKIEAEIAEIFSGIAIDKRDQAMSLVKDILQATRGPSTSETMSRTPRQMGEGMQNA